MAYIAPKQLGSGTPSGTNFLRGDGTWAVPAGGTAAPLPSVQARRTTAYTLTGAFADITLDTTDVENDTAVVEHNNTNTERIDIKETGEYLIIYETVWQPGTTLGNSCSLRVYKNGTTLVAGSDMSDVSSGDTNDHPVGRAVVASLTDGDYITLQAQVVTVEGVLAAGTIFAVVRLQGTKGDTGPTGPAGTSIDTPRFALNGKLKVVTGVDGAFIVPRAGTITRITLWRRTAGTSGSTIVDVNKNGTTVYTTQANRPTVTSGGGANAIDATTDMDVTAVAQDDRLEVDVDAIEAGNPMDLAVTIEITYT